MADFHRLVLPTYNGGLPVSHDYINNPAANGDAGVPAPVDVKKAIGPNAGTYFVAFNEPGIASNANRGQFALAENTDWLDDVVHRDLAEPVITASVTPGAPVAALVLSGDVWVSLTAGSTQRVRTGLVAILNGAGEPLTILVGAAYVPVLVTLIHDGLSNDVIGNGFESGPTIAISPSIPSGQSYRLAYSTRASAVTVGAGLSTRLASGITALGEIYALARTTDLLSAKLAADNVMTGENNFTGNNTFDGDDTHNGNDVHTGNESHSGSETFTGEMKLDRVAADQPRAETTIYNANFVQIWESKTNNAPNMFMRMYTYGPTPFGGYGGFALVTNARWDSGTGLWTADNTGTNATMMVVSHTGMFTLTREDTTVTWNSAGWTVSANAFSGMGDGGFAASILDSDRPLLQTTTKSEDHPGAPTNRWKELFKFPCTATTYARAYVGGITPAGPVELFCITLNAVWDPDSALWSLDDDASNALQFKMVAEDGGNAIFMYGKGTLSADWIDTAWDNTNGSLFVGDKLSVGDTIEAGDDVITGGDFLYATPRTGYRYLSLENAFIDDLNKLSHPIDPDPGYIEGPTFVIAWDFTLPPGASLTEIRIKVDPQVANNIVAFVQATEGAVFGGSVPVNRGVTTLIDSGDGFSTARSWISLNGGDHILASYTEGWYTLIVQIVDAGQVQGVRIEYKSLGVFDQG